MNVPLEDEECEVFVEWLETKRLKFNHIKNENTTRSIPYAMKMQRLGVRKGFPDYIVFANAKQTYVKEAVIFFIEMKRQKSPPSRTSPEQKRWIKNLDTVPYVAAKICKGADEAIDFIKEYLK